MSLRNKIATVMCGLALVGTIGMPAAALAENNETDETNQTSGTTEVKVQTDPSNTQLDFEVPTVINFAADADGKLIAPNADSLKIKNRSVFPIHVTNMKVQGANGWSVVDDASKAKTQNNIQFKLNGAAASSKGVDLSKNSAWNMTYMGSAGDSIKLLASDGLISGVTQDLDKTAQVATITWTLAAGEAQQQ